MTDQKHTKEILISSPNRNSKMYNLFIEMVARAKVGEVGLFATAGTDLVIMSSDKHEDLRRQRDELRVALDNIIKASNGSGSFINAMVEGEKLLTKTKESV